MWKKPWRYKEGFICGQDCSSRACCCSGALEIFVGACLRGRSMSSFWCCSCYCWHGCMDFANGCTVSDGSSHIRLQFLPWYVCGGCHFVVMGIGAAGSFYPPSADVIGFRRCFFGRFVLLYIWLVTVLGLTILRVCIPLKLRKIPFLLNHVGLFVALLTATLGNADMQRLRMI